MHILLRGSLAQRLRIASGLMLFAFATTHFLNHALGLVDLKTMHEVEALRKIVTRSVPGTIVLSGALVTHMALALAKLARRTTLRLQAWELIQIALGLFIPFVLLAHIVNTRIVHVFLGVEDNYLYELARLWPSSALLQSTLLVVGGTAAWAFTFGCVSMGPTARCSPSSCSWPSRSPFAPSSASWCRGDWSRPRSRTVAGNAVNVASRLETVARQKGCQVVMSADVAAKQAVWRTPVRC